MHYTHAETNLKAQKSVATSETAQRARFLPPAADVNLLKVPQGKRDEAYVLLSDILPTAWHANELGQVGEGDRVAIWGAGPGKERQSPIKKAVFY